MSLFIILVYDIGEKRVAKVLHICRKYLTWVQNSVFEGEISKPDLLMLKEEVRGVIEHATDSVLFFQFRTKRYYEKDVIGMQKGEEEQFF